MAVHARNIIFYAVIQTIIDTSKGINSLLKWKKSVVVSLYTKIRLHVYINILHVYCTTKFIV